MTHNTKTLREFDPPLAVEHLVYEVKTAAFEKWKAAEFEFWTRGEAERFPFYRGKETWLQQNGDVCLVTIIIYWNSVQEWHSIDSAWLDETERQFSAVVGAENYRLVFAAHAAGQQSFKISEYRSD